MSRAAVAALLLAALAASAAAAGGCAARGPVCRLTPLRVGICKLGADHVLGDGYSADERLTFAIYAFLVEGPGGERALIDLGPETLEYTNAMFRRFGFFRDLGPGVPAAERYPDDVVQPEGNVFRHLERLGIPPAEIDHIVFTHLHADHHGMDDASDGGAAERFESAHLHVSAAGWRDNLEKRRGGRWGSYVDFAFSDFLLERSEAGKVRFEDDAEVFPGLRTVHLGGHSPCSRAVVVETADGPAIIASDEVYLYRLLEEGVLPRIRVSEERYRAALDRLAGLAAAEGGVILPLHDPLLWEARRKAGEGWLRELRPHSDRAIRGYLAARGRRAPAAAAGEED